MTITLKETYQIGVVFYTIIRLSDCLKVIIFQKFFGESKTAKTTEIFLVKQNRRCSALRSESSMML